MNIANSPRQIIVTSLIALAALTLPAMHAGAATDTWTAGAGNWTNGSNWGTSTTPNPATMANTGDQLTFNGAGGGTSTNDLTSGTFGGITFASGAGAYTITGSGAEFITLSGAQGTSSQVPFGGNITNNSANTETITSPLTLSGGNYSIGTGAGAGALDLNGAITQAQPVSVQFSTGGGVINVTSSGLTDDSSNSGGIIGGWATIGSNFATINGSGNIVAYSGYTTVSQGSAISSNVANNIELTGAGNGTASTVSGATISINSLIWSPSAATATETINFGTNGTLLLGAQGGIFNANPNNNQLNIGNTTTQGVLTAGGTVNNPGTLSLTDITNGWLEVETHIKNNGSGVVTLNITDTGNSSVQLHDGNSYTGNTYINQGRVQADVTSSFGTGTVYVAPGAEAFLNSGGTVSNNFNIAGYGDINNTASGWGDPMALRVQTNTLSGSVTLSGTAVIGTGNSSTFTGPISGAGGMIIIGSYGAGSMHLGQSSPLTYQGDTTIDSAAYGGVGAEQVTVWVNTSTHNNILPYGSSAGNLILIGGALSQYAQFDLGGSTQNINGLSSGSTGVAADTNVTSNPSGGTLVEGNNNATSTFGGTIGSFNGSGTAGVSLTKVGTGTLTLSGTNNYTGTTTVQNGILVVTGSLATAGNVTLDDTTLSGNPVLAGNGNGTSSGVLGNVTLPTNNGSDIATISPGTTGTTNSIGKLTLTSLTMNGGQMDLALTNANTAGTTYSFINVLGALTLPTTSWTLTTNGGAAAGVYTVLTAGGATNIGIAGTADLPTVNFPAGNPLLRPATYTPSWASTTSLLLTVGGGAQSVIWTGTAGSGGNGIWDISTTHNWSDGGAGNFYDGDAVTFDDTGINPNITIQSGTNGEANVQPSSVTVSANSTNYTIGGNSIISVGGLTKSGNSTLTLTGSNSFAGTSNINGGILNLGNAGALGGSGNIAFGGGTLQYSASSQEDISSQIASSGSAIQIDTNGQSVSYGSAIGSSNTGGLIKSGAGTLTLNGANTYTGNTVINSGTLVLTAASGGNGALASANIDVNAGTTLVLSNNDTLGFTGGRNVLTINDGTVLNNVSGDRDTLWNAVTMTGGTMAAAGAGNSGGAYSWANGGGLTATSDASGNPAVISAQTALQSNTVFTVNRGTDVSGLSPDLLVSGIIAEEGGGGNNLTFGGNGITELTAANSYRQTTTINSGATVILGNGGTAGSLATSSSNTITDNGTLIFDRSNAVTEGTDFAKGITGSGAVTQVGSGTLNFNSTETYQGATTVSAGTLNLTGSLNGTASTTVTNATLEGTGNIETGVVTIGNGSNAAGSAILEPGADPAVGTLTTGSSVSLLSDAAFVFNLDSTNGGTGNGSSELIALSVSLDPSSEFTFDDIASTPGALTLGTVFTAISTTNGLTGTFSNLSNGEIFSAAGNDYQASYASDSLTFTVVPEPGTWGFIIFGFGMLLGIQKLRKRPMGI